MNKIPKDPSKTVLRPYVVIDTQDQSRTLVKDCTSPTQGMKVFLDDLLQKRFTIRAAKVQDVIDFISSGKIISAKDRDHGA